VYFNHSISGAIRGPVYPRSAVRLMPIAPCAHG